MRAICTSVVTFAFVAAWGVSDQGGANKKTKPNEPRQAEVGAPKTDPDSIRGSRRSSAVESIHANKGNGKRLGPPQGVFGTAAGGSPIPWARGNVRVFMAANGEQGSTGVGAGDRPADVGSSQDTPPEGLTHSDWSSIRGEYERHRHAAVSVEGGFRARNPGQQWLTHFDGRGFVTTPDSGVHQGGSASWSWGMELVSFGVDGAERPVTTPACVRADGTRVMYDWDAALTEWYINDTRGLEHGYTVHRRPLVRNPLERESVLAPLVRESVLARYVAGILSGEGAHRGNATLPGGPAMSSGRDSREKGCEKGFSHQLEKGREKGFSHQLSASHQRSAPHQLLASHQRSAPHQLLTPRQVSLTLAVRGDLRPRVSDDGRNVMFVGSHGASVVSYAGLTVFDADGVALPAWFEPVGEGLRLIVSDDGARYPLTIDPVAQQAYLKASNTGGDDAFGFSVAVSGDTVVVGAIGEDSNATGLNGDQTDNSAPASGAAYVFVRDGGGVWSQEAYLKASNTGTGDWFGYSVAVSGDTVVVGANLEASSATGVNGDQTDNSAGDSGAAYVFVRSGGVWSQQAYLKASNTGASDYFGYSVAVSGDTVVVGAWLEDSSATGVNGDQTDNSASSSGAAYVFVRSGGVWSQQAYLKASNTGTGDWFGYSVAVSGDTVVVGGFAESSNATGVNGDQSNDSASLSGAAYVFVRSGGVWSQQAYLKASNTGSFDRFGISVAVSGDTVVVGAYLEDSNATGVDSNQADNSATFAGAAYVFVRDGGGVWSQQAYLKASNTGASDYFGYSVSVSGDTVVVGANLEASSATGVNGDQTDNSAGDSGAAYVFVRSGGVWSQQAYLKASNTGAGDQFGISVAVSGDTVVVGAVTEDSNATGVNGNQTDNSASSSGAAYVFIIVPCVSDLDCADQNVCTCDRCVNNVCQHAPNEYGNSDCTSIVEIGDVTCILAGYNNIEDCVNGDVDPPCTGNDPPFIDIGDVLAILDAYGGFDPCGCPP